MTLVNCQKIVKTLNRVGYNIFGCLGICEKAVGMVEVGVGCVVYSYSCRYDELFRALENIGTLGNF